jgi:hypothetical protein
MVHVVVHLRILVNIIFSKESINLIIIKVVYVIHLLIPVQLILVNIMVYVYQRQQDINVNVQLLIQVHYVKYLLILVIIHHVEMVVNAILQEIILFIVHVLQVYLEKKRIIISFDFFKVIRDNFVMVK